MFILYSRTCWDGLQSQHSVETFRPKPSLNMDKIFSRRACSDSAVNKSHLIDVLTRLLRQRSAASRNNRPLPSQTAHVCERSDGHMGRADCDCAERPLIQHLSSERLRVNKNKTKPVHSHLCSRALSSRLSVFFLSLDPTKSRHLLSLLMLCDRSHLLSPPAAHLLSPTIWWRAKTVICSSLLTNHCAVKSAFCLPQPWKQLQSASVSAVIALHISWQRFVDGEIEKQIYFSQSMKGTGRSFKPASQVLQNWVFTLHSILWHGWWLDDDPEHLLIKDGE